MSLLLLDEARSRSYQILYLDLLSIEPQILGNLDNFLRWFCLTLGQKLNLINSLHNHWDTSILGSTDNCTNYLKEHILPNLDQPLVLAIDDLDQLFPYPEVTQYFLRMLNRWHENSKSVALWQKLRLAIAYSTASPKFWEINPIFFNCGVLVELEDFQEPQIQNLIDSHQLSFSQDQVNALTAMLGGHPYLIRVALYSVRATSSTLDTVLKGAITNAGIYSHYLYQHILILQQTPELTKALKTILASDKAIAIHYNLVYQLYHLGLIKKHGDQVTIKYDLYYHYFKTYISQIN